MALVSGRARTAFAETTSQTFTTRRISGAACRADRVRARSAGDVLGWFELSVVISPRYWGGGGVGRLLPSGGRVLRSGHEDRCGRWDRRGRQARRRGGVRRRARARGDRPLAWRGPDDRRGPGRRARRGGRRRRS